MPYRTLKLGNGRDLEFHVSGPAKAESLLVFHVGSPSAAVGYPGLTAAAAARGMRTVCYSRQGYAGSTRNPGRRVSDEAAITALLANHLGHERFFTIGWSGGGPAALACAALLPERVRASLTLASPSPPDEAGRDWWGWVKKADVAEFRTLRTEARDSLIPEYREASAEFANMRPSLLGQLPGTPEADRAAARGRGGTGAPLARSMRRALSAGIWGWFDDGVALAGDWGFEVSGIHVPVIVRHGELDPLVDPRHGQWLGRTIPGAHLQKIPEGGHGSIFRPFETIVGLLVDAAGA
jgi:pimeloyl-ACP methyl ester carboxylesterase